jgi:molybdopterin converting factor subunit 1
MEIRVHFFGRTREVAGLSEERLGLPEGTTVAQAAERLAERHPGLAPHLARCSFAVNESYAGRDAPLAAGDELAVIPPIGGG